MEGKEKAKRIMSLIAGVIVLLGMGNYLIKFLVF